MRGKTRESAELGGDSRMVQREAQNVGSHAVVLANKPDPLLTKWSPDKEKQGERSQCKRESQEASQQERTNNHRCIITGRSVCAEFSFDGGVRRRPGE